MESLVQALQLLDTSSSLPDVDGDDMMVLQAGDHPLVLTISSLCNSLLITNEGVPNFDAIDTLWHNHQYFVTPGDRDKFGWVTGCLHTKKGIIVFG